MNGSFFIRHKTGCLCAVLACAAVCGALLTRVRPDETIHAMIPAAVREKVELFEHSPLNKKIFAVVSAPSAEEAETAAQTLRENLETEHLVSAPFAPGPDFALELFYALPPRFTEQDARAAEQILSPEYVSQKMRENYENLLSMEGLLLKPLISADPLGLTGMMTRKLAALGAGTGVDFKGGFLISPDGKTLIGLYDYTGEDSFRGAAEFSARFTQLAGSLGENVRAFYLGGLRYTVENISVIRADLWRVTALALVALAAVFFIFLRRKSALLIYLLPIIILPPAALVTYAVFGGISGITLGFGSVVAGLSADYSIYLFFAMQKGRQSPQEAVKRLKKHLLCNFMTSSLCFAALFCSSVELFKQIAVFSVTGLLLALLLALYIFPPFWTDANNTASAPAFTVRALPKKWALGIACATLILGAWGAAHTNFSGDVEDLNSTSAEFKAQKAVFDAAFARASADNALVFVKGSSVENAIENNEKASVLFPTQMAVSGVLPSARAKRENAARWNDFWNAPRTQYARLLIEEESAKTGLNPAAFAPFWNQLKNPAEDTFDFTQLYNPVAKLKDGAFAVVNVVPNTPEYETAAQNAGAVFVSGAGLKKELLASVRGEAVKIVFLSLLFNLLAVFLVLKNLRETLFCFVPVVLAGCFTFGCFWAFGVKVNLFVLVFLPLLTGLGIDYGIFQVMKFRSGGREHTVYPPTALWTAGLSTLAGFGVLALAKHGVLFIMGLSSFLGICGAMLAAQFILPAFLENKTCAR